MPVGVKRGAPIVWTDANIAKLRELMAAGHTTRTAGLALGCPKNAVVGKTRRLGIKSIHSNGRDKKAPKPPDAPKKVATQKPAAQHGTLPPLPSISAAPFRMSPPPIIRRFNPGRRLPPVIPAAAPEAEPAAPVVFKPRRPGACCWPMWGTVKPTHVYCDADTVLGRVYCEKHCGMAYGRGFDQDEPAAPARAKPAPVAKASTPRKPQTGFGKYERHTPEQIQHRVAVIQSQPSIRQAAAILGVHPTGLGDWWRRYQAKAAPYPNPRPAAPDMKTPALARGCIGG